MARKASSPIQMDGTAADSYSRHSGHRLTSLTPVPPQAHYDVRGDNQDGAAPRALPPVLRNTVFRLSAMPI